MVLAGFELAIPTSEWPQTHGVDRAATGIGCTDNYPPINLSIYWGANPVVHSVTILKPRKKSMDQPPFISPSNCYTYPPACIPIANSRPVV